MERISRGAFQGVWNIVRFNSQFYVIAIAAISLLLCLIPVFSGVVLVVVYCALFFAVWNTLISLLVSWYIYDGSGLYSMAWLDDLYVPEGSHIVNIHAGFDETSGILKEIYPGSRLEVYDFYDAGKHTEVSIRRARAAYAPYPGTKQVQTGNLALGEEEYDLIFLIFAAHEIRDMQERQEFFRALKRSLRQGGQLVVVEHLRDLPNFIAYTVGFFHFLSRNTWVATFAASGLKAIEERKINPFVTLFYLR
jgi:SAM-dependent methyltransferase